MGSALDLWKSKQKDRWEQVVSQLIDAVVAALGGGSGGGSLGELDVVETRRAGLDQLLVGAGSDIVLNNIVFTRGEIAYDFNTGVYTLQPLKVYELDFSAFFTSFSDATGGGLEIAWVDANTNAPLDTNISGIFKPSTSTDPSNESPRAHAVFISEQAAQVKLRCINATGTATLSGPSGGGSSSSGAVVKQLR